MMALLLLVAPAQPYVHPPQGSEGVQAVVSLEVRERRDLHAPPRAWVELRITGPATLKVEPAKFTSEVRAWRIVSASSWTPTATGLVVTQSFVLEQTRAGEQPLPGLSVAVRARARPDGAEQMLEWPDLFGGPPTPPDLEELPTVPVPDWMPVYVGAAVLLAGLVALLVWRVTRRPLPVHVPTPQEIAVAALAELTHPTAWTDPRAAATRLGTILRDYLGARTGLDLHTRTVRECLNLLRACPQVAAESLPDLEALLLWCDATRFAGPQADASAGPGQAARARAWVARRTEPEGTLACAS